MIGNIFILFLVSVTYVPIAIMIIKSDIDIYIIIIMPRGTKTNANNNNIILFIVFFKTKVYVIIFTSINVYYCFYRAHAIFELTVVEQLNDEDTR